MKRFFRLSLVIFLVCAALVARVRPALAAPEAHILRIDPRAGISNGAPLLTTVVEVVQFNSLSSVVQACANVTGFNPTLDCLSTQLEKPGAVWSPFPFPEANARLLVKINGADTLATLDGKPEKWGDSQKQPDVGTAWLVVLDASSSMGSRYGEARAIARQFIENMQPNDQMNLQIFDDRFVIQSTKGWKTYKERNDLVALLNAQQGTAPSHGRDRALFGQLKAMTADGFGSLGNSQGPSDIPLHQAMVVLSNGSGRNDAESAAPSAEVFHQFVTKGRFPDDNTSAPKTPLPVISVWFPSGSSLVNDVFRNNDEQFMQALANPEIGGFFDIVREGQGEAKGKIIIGLIKQRFNAMFIAKWRLACLNPTVEQTFNLEFQNVKPAIKGDASFKDVPIGIDPSQWPLDVDLAKTKAEADANPLYPGGTFKAYGNFCWGGDSKRAEAYFIPAGSKPDPNANSTDLATVKKAQQNLIAQNMRGSPIEAGDTFVTFQVPDEEKVIEGNGDNAVARVLIYDNAAHRASGHDEKTILTLKAQKKPFNLPLILGIAGGLVVLLLLVIVVLRGGGGGRGKKSRGAPPAPVVAGGGGGYGAPGGQPQGPPAGGYGGGGGGYGAAPPQQQQPPPQQNAPYVAPAYAPAPVAYGSAGVTPPPAVVQVRCPACQAMTMATPGQPSVCFSCGQPLPANIAEGGGGALAPTFPAHGSAECATVAASAESVRGSAARGDHLRNAGKLFHSPRNRSARGARSGAVRGDASRAARERRTRHAEVRAVAALGA